MNRLKIMTSLVLLSLPALTYAASGDTVASTGSVAPAVTSSPLNEALNVSGAPKVVSQTPTSVTLEWSKVTPASSYIVKYSKTSVAEAFKLGKTSAVYEVETDPVTSTGTTIKDLKADTTYYFAVVALDKDKNESPTNSEELSVKLTSTEATNTGSVTPTTTSTGTSATASFKLMGVSVVDEMTLSLEFSAPVSSLSPIALKVMKTSDKTTVSQKSAVVDPKNVQKVIVTLATKLLASSTYSTTVIQAKDTTGNPVSE
jgi:Fibronectin type III domain